MSRRNVPYGLTLDQNSAVRPRRSSSLSFFAQAGSARTCFFGKTAWIGLGLHHQWWYCTDQCSFRHSAIAVPAQIVGHLAAAGRMADVNGVPEIEMCRQRRKVVA